MSQEDDSAAQEPPVSPTATGLRLPSLREAYEEGLRRGSAAGFEGFERSMYAGSYATQLLRMEGNRCHTVRSHEEFYALRRWQEENAWLLERRGPPPDRNYDSSMAALLKADAKAVVSLLEGKGLPHQLRQIASTEDQVEAEVRRLLGLRN